jgi:CII-binding regulator of phage lambda lysogenization HflD
MTLETINKLQTQQRHMDILEEKIFELADQLKTMRAEHEEIMTTIIEENR